MDFFCIALRHLKSKFPHLKIGGPAFCNAWRDEYNDLLFTALNKEGLSMDFFSFHGYWNEPYKYAEDGELMAETLRKLYPLCRACRQYHLRFSRSLLWEYDPTSACNRQLRPDMRFHPQNA